MIFIITVKIHNLSVREAKTDTVKKQIFSFFFSNGSLPCEKVSTLGGNKHWAEKNKAKEVRKEQLRRMNNERSLWKKRGATRRVWGLFLLQSAVC